MNTTTTDTWTLGMPYWEGVWDTDRPDAYGTDLSSWDTVHMYCDLETHDTVAQIDEEEGWCAYRWTEAGEGHMAQTTDRLWWILDDLLWGPCYWWDYRPDGRKKTEAEERADRGWPADDLLYELAMVEMSRQMYED